MYSIPWLNIVFQLEAQRNAIMQVQRQLSQQREWLEQQIVQSSFLHDHTQVCFYLSHVFLLTHFRIALLKNF